ncbi:MAG: hypothetical protein ACE5I1_10235 [bacterium]
MTYQVAHAIDNKTIMIIQEKDKVPFDVSSYSCIEYTQNTAGLANTVSLADFKAAQETLKERDALLTNSVPQAELEALQKQLSEREKLLDIIRSDLEKTQTELKDKTTEIRALKSQTPPEAPAKKPVLKPKIKLRSQLIEKFSTDTVMKMLQEKNFFDSSRNKAGKVLRTRMNCRRTRARISLWMMPPA